MEDCKNLKAEIRMLGKEKHRLPHESLIRSKYHEKLKTFKKTCKSKIYFFLQDNLRNIESSLGDSKSFWEKWKRFDENDTPKENMKISGGNLYNYFSNLHKETSNANEEVVDPKPSLCNSTKEEKLNKPFTKKEFKKIIENLLNNKSEGLDGIRNEMIKNCPEIVYSIYCISS